MGCGGALLASGPFPEAALTVDIPGGLPSAIGVFANVTFAGIVDFQSNFQFGTFGDGFYNCCDVPPTGSLTVTIAPSAGAAQFRAKRHRSAYDRADFAHAPIALDYSPQPAPWRVKIEEIVRLIS